MISWVINFISRKFHKHTQNLLLVFIWSNVPCYSSVNGCTSWKTTTFPVPIISVSELSMNKFKLNKLRFMNQISNSSCGICKCIVPSQWRNVLLPCHMLHFFHFFFIMANLKFIHCWPTHRNIQYQQVVITLKYKVLHYKGKKIKQTHSIKWGN